jgi:putative FmdB family regulatory protein
MPTYDYRCAKCGEDLEVYQSFSEAPLTRHKGCGGKLAKVLSPAGIVLKGSGFYKTDNRSNGKRSGEKKDAASNGDSSSKSSESKSADSGGSSSGDGKSSGSGSTDAKKPAAKSA